MTKELLTVEFRYLDEPKYRSSSEYISKIITIGIYDSLEEAIEKGNETLKNLSKYFEVRDDDKFKLHHLFGSPKRMVTNCCYPTKNIQYFAKITTLKYDDLIETVEETFKACTRHVEYRKREELDE